MSVSETSEASSRGFALRMRGDDADQLEIYAERFAELVREIPNVTEVRTDSEFDKDEVQLKINEDIAEQLGVNAFTIAQTVDFALRGIRLSDLKSGEREVRVWAQYNEEDRKTRANLENIEILTEQSGLVPLHRLVELERARSPQAINRVNGKNVTTIAAKFAGDNMAGVVEQLRPLIQNFEMKRGYVIEFGDELVNLDESLTNFMTALLLAIVLIYIVMGALFESYILPLSILVTVPLAFLGVVWALWITDTSVDTVALIGVIVLVGIVVNNGIVIVDHINQLRAHGVNRRRAVIQAGRDRFRPVMMTALTTILGCVPLAVGSGVGGEISFAGLGRALIGGLTTGTLLTLGVVPLIYTLIDDVGLWANRYLANVTNLVAKRSANP